VEKYHVHVCTLRVAFAFVITRMVRELVVIADDG